ncbi:MAG: GatB/YqeY domain-containing protein [Candidatus Geothermincolia bacterium]
MSLKETLAGDSRKALKSGDKLRLSTVRMLLSEIKNAEIAKRDELTEEEALQIAAREARKRKEAIEEFAKGGRQDLVDKETYELSVLQEYLPAQMSDEEVERIVAETIAEAGASSPSDLGKVMGLLMPKIKGKADGKKVNQLVREMLQQ